MESLEGGSLIHRNDLSLPAQVIDFSAVRRSRRIARQAALIGLHELLRPGVVKALGAPLEPAKFADAVLAAQTVEHDADLLLGGIVFARRQRMSLTPRSDCDLGNPDFGRISTPRRLRWARYLLVSSTR